MATVPATPWQRPLKHMQLRLCVVADIMSLLKSRKPDASLEWLEHLPAMAKRCEAQLYMRAPSLQVYMDGATLKTRLQKVAVEMTASRA